MKIHKKEISAKDAHGRIELEAEGDDDMWHLYNMIRKGDSIKCTTQRKVKNTTNTGHSTSKKITLNLIVKVETVIFESEGCTLRINGKTIGQNDHVPLGSYHSLEIEVNTKFSLTKGCWDSIILEELDEACDPSKRADVAVAVMQEGLCNVGLILSSITVIKAKIEVNIPKKRKGFTNNHDKSIQKFYLQILKAICQHLDFEVVKCLIIASPGYVKDEFLKFAFNECEKDKHSANEYSSFYENKSKILKLHCSDGYKHSLRDVLSQPNIANRLADTKCAEELKTLDEFYEKLHKQPDWAVYGKKEVFAAAKESAIRVLLISDLLFRSPSVQVRKRFVNLVEELRGGGVKVLKFSSMHVSGERLNELTGIAAILRFPINFDDVSEESDIENDVR